MRPVGVVVAILVAFVVETTMLRFVRGLPPLDLLLVVVVFVALRFGPITGLLAGALAGLIQDYGLSNGIIGIGGLSSTIVGFLVGTVGTQFIVSGPIPRFVVFFAATVLYQVVTIGLGVLLDLRAFGTPYAAVAAEGLVNATVGLVLFQLVEIRPGAFERRRMRR